MRGEERKNEHLFLERDNTIVSKANSNLSDEL